MATLILDASQWPQPWASVLYEVVGDSPDHSYQGPLDDQAPISTCEIPPGSYRVTIYSGSRVLKLWVKVKDSEGKVRLSLPDPRSRPSSEVRGIAENENQAELYKLPLKTSVERRAMKLSVCSSRVFLESTNLFKSLDAGREDSEQQRNCWMRMWSSPQPSDVLIEKWEPFQPISWLGTLVEENRTEKVFRLRQRRGIVSLLEYGIVGLETRFTLLPPGDVTLRTTKPTASSTAQGGQPISRVPNIEIDVPNSLGDTLLNLLTRGDMARATALGETFVRNHKHSGRLDLISALAGGYYLSRLQEYWDLLFWCRDVLARFGRIPDSLVLHAWASLKTGGIVDIVSGDFRDVLGTGLPYFTEGLQILVDGLRVFGSEHERAESKFNAYTNAAIWTQPYTTYTGDSPNQPGRISPKSTTPEPEDRDVVFW